MAELSGTLNRAPTVLYPSKETIDFFGIEGEYKISGGKAKYIVNIRLRLYASSHMELNVNVPCDLKLEYTATGDSSYSVSGTKSASAVPLANINGTGYGTWTSWDLFKFELPADKQLSQISMNVSLDLYNIVSTSSVSPGIGGPGSTSKPGQHYRWLYCNGSNNQLKSITEWQPAGTAPTGLRLSNGDVGTISKDHLGETMSASTNSVTVNWKVSSLGNPEGKVQWSINGVDWHTTDIVDSTGKGGSVTISVITKDGVTHALEAYTLYTIKFKVSNASGSINDSIQIRTAGYAPSKFTLTNGNPGIEAGSSDKSKGVTVSADTKSVTVNWKISSRGTPRCTIEYTINKDVNDWKTLLDVTDTKTSGSVTINKIRKDDNIDHNLISYTAYTIEFRATNIMGTQSETIRIRTAPTPPIITEFTLANSNLESLKFRVKTNAVVAKVEYNEYGTSEWITAANPGDVDLNMKDNNGSADNTFTTVNYLAPDTSHSMRVRLTTTHGGVTISNYIQGNTLSPAYLLSIGDCIFGLPINLQVQTPKDPDTSSCVVTLIFSNKYGLNEMEIPSSEIAHLSSYTFNLTQDQLDTAYKLYPHNNANEYTIAFTTKTIGAERFGYKEYSNFDTAKYVLTGIAKTAYVGIYSPHRAQCWVGVKNGNKIEVRRAVAWIGTPMGPRRCI